MSNTIKLRALTVLFCFVLAVAALAPTIARDSLPDWWRGIFEPIPLGLDLPGGMHLVLGVEVDKAVEARLDTIADQLQEELKSKDVAVKRVVRQGDMVTVTVYDEAGAKQLDALMTEQFRGMESATPQGSGDFIAKGYRLSATEADNVREYAIHFCYLWEWHNYDHNQPGR